MIDWITAILPCNHDSDRLDAGFVASVNANGDPEWMVSKKLTVEGSFSSKIQIKSHKDGYIFVSGNPVKFLQGHNIFGSSDLLYIVNKFFLDLVARCDFLTPTDFQLNQVKRGDYKLSRVDINDSWHLENRNQVLSWLRAVGDSATLKHRGRGEFSGDTVYFGKKSRRWALKCYSKGAEINVKGRGLPSELLSFEILDYAEKALRLEVVIRRMELVDLELDTASNWGKDTANVLLLNYLSKLNLSDKFMLDTSIVNQMPSRLRLIYQAWANGDDLKDIISTASFYRNRKIFLERYGIDIGSTNRPKNGNVIPIIRVLEAVPAGIPQWAYDRNLVA